MISAGVRYEHIVFKYFVDKRIQLDQSRVYDNFFPNASLTELLGPVQTQLSYAVKTQRPSYHQLRNSVTYIDRYSLDKGTPTLQPQTTHDLLLTGAWKFLTLSTSYKIKEGTFVQWGEAQPDNPDAMMLTTHNYGKPIPEFNAFISASPKIGCWMPSLTIGATKQWYRGETISMNKPICVAYFTNIIQFQRQFMITASFNYQSKGHT